MMKDMGNTNFSIHLPRISFNRHVTAQVVVRAVRSLNIDAWVNDRNDVCVGPYKMSILWLSDSTHEPSFLRHPRLWFCLQDCQGSSVPPWNNAHLIPA
jgi:hypothetical protein